MGLDMTAQLAPLVWSMIGLMIVSGISVFASHD